MYDPPKMEKNVNCESYWAMKHETPHFGAVKSPIWILQIHSAAGAWPPACRPGFRLREVG